MASKQKSKSLFFYSLPYLLGIAFLVCLVIGLIKLFIFSTVGFWILIGALVATIISICAGTADRNLDRKKNEDGDN